MLAESSDRPGKETMDKTFGDLLDIKDLHPAALEKIFKSLSEVGKEVTRRKNDVFFDFHKDVQNIVLIQSGSIGFYRKSDRLLIAETAQQSVIGLLHFSNKPDVMVVAHSSVKIKIVPRDIALEIIEKEGLWHEVAVVFGHMIKLYVERDLNFIARDAYHIIKHHLNILMALPVEERYETTAARFITNRSNLSRSRVMDILKALNDGGYIVIKNGILLKINSLPDGF